MGIRPHSLLLLYYHEFELDFSNFVLLVQIQPFQMIRKKFSIFFPKTIKYFLTHSCNVPIPDILSNEDFLQNGTNEE